ncbi:MAG TPA: SDR family oxidoreductase [Phycisphaerae bacterium]|nr:SDR family oxidoreductase [Phycisphaerae bacterium]HOJ76259.1 SDR family oxidoreductase [Phycisphaerae bacterium]HOM53633.1 SDR family oxidoreductase [Phycisphaerae bacterium]HOQ86057.1 SDR family oxidoreductase [Phycisphaerae bacterium]HPP29002.1 SDR family oxidoreductase [Phycisphaerae bacterium]
MDIKQLFDLTGKSAAITGGGGVLCGAIAQCLASAGAQVAVLDLKLEAAQAVADQINKAGGKAIAVAANVLDRPSMEAAYERCVEAFGKVDILVNGAGGNHPSATTGPDKRFFDLPIDAFEKVMDLNIIGTILPSMVFAKAMAERGEGVILNIASMNAFRPLTKIAAYSAAKAGVKNFTEWLAVHLAQEYSPRIRVNGVAPGFFLTEQNRFLLTDKETGEMTPRGKTIIAHTPMGRYGAPEDLFGAVLWLCSPASAFVTGITVPVDGGFSAFSGV